MCKGKGGVQCTYEDCMTSVHPSCCRRASDDAVRMGVMGSVDRDEPAAIRVVTHLAIP